MENVLVRQEFVEAPVFANRPFRPAEPVSISIPDSHECLNFDKDKVQVITLSQLKRTHKEDDAYGYPMKGVYHSDLIEGLGRIIEDAGLEMQIDEIFAAQNKEKTQPGVALLPKVEEIYGSHAIEAHILRRVFANISIHNLDDDEFTTNLAVAFHQNGIQVGFGNMVKVCHNQCLLGADSVVSTYGKNKVTLDTLFETVKNWMSNFNEKVIRERERLNRLKDVIVTPDTILKMIGTLTAIRVAHDTTYDEIKSHGVYPLSQTQINKFTEELMLIQHRQAFVSLWNIYNVATDLYKADRMEIPNILPQQEAMRDFIMTYM